MFTGIIEEIGRLRALRVGAQSAELEIEAYRVLEGTRVGDSIATAGVCLSVTGLAHRRFTADAMPETVRRTTLADLMPGAALNLERALTPQSRLGGHMVTGHVDGVGRVTGVRRDETALVVSIGAPAEVLDLCVGQGSVAVDGVSLTIVDVDDASMRVSLIPHTAAATTLGQAVAGLAVNLEADVIGKYVRAFLRKARPVEGLTWEKLSEAGFL